MRAPFRLAAFLLLISVRVSLAQDSADVIVYGGTSAGVTAAVEAGRMGKTVILVEPSQHLGGMTSGGLGETDIGKYQTVGGLAREFYARIFRYYEAGDTWRQETRAAFIARRPDGHPEKEKMQWVFEPHVAEAMFRTLASEAHVTLAFGERINLKHGVVREGNHIASIRCDSGRTFAGKVFIDCSYEGDLLAQSGVDWTVGREDNATYGETLNGIRFLKAMDGADPFVKPGDAASGLLPGIEPAIQAAEGTSDKLTQAYTFRVCLTDAKDNQQPIEQPAHYDPLRYELLARQLIKKPDMRPGKTLFKLSAMPNCKTDSNNTYSALSTDFIGESSAWTEADYDARAAIWQKHKDYVQGLFWFLGRDPRLSADLRAAVLKWQLPKDEFKDSGGWPFQLYVRESRRMVGAYVITQHDALDKKPTPDPVGLASYLLDCHETRRFVDADNHIHGEGVYYTKMPDPMPISYRALTPRKEQCTNLLVPVCCSASHVAYGTIRMEPVYMILGQSAGAAAAMAVGEKLAVQDVPYAALHARLESDRQILAAKQ